ncbi:39S ribosomal protein L38, mitochondrial-like isoform X1 [Argonauta hians]
MAVTLARKCNGNFKQFAPLLSIPSRLSSVYSRPIQPILTFEDRMKKIKEKDPISNPDINIGLPLQRILPKRKLIKRLKHWNTERLKLEQDSRLLKLEVDTEKVNEESLNEQWSTNVHRIATHYGIYRDLFDNAYFYPRPVLNIFYDYDEEFVTIVYNGNKILPSEAFVEPYVRLDVPSDEKDSSFWSLVLTSPDSHLQDNTSEYLHWFVGNIPGNQIENGEIICNYLPPFPLRGTGFHRYVFLLYKQSKKLDFSSELRPPNCKSLEQRTFKNIDFYKKYEDDLTAVSLQFFQCEWDKSVTQLFHNTLEMCEPSFEFIHPVRYLPEEKKWPHRKPFNKFLDNYRDSKEIQEEVLKKKLKDSSPFKPPSPRPEYPNIQPLSPGLPKWYRTKISDMRLGKKQWEDLYKLD